MKSCIYEGNVTHRRFEPVSHDFRYRMFMMYLDLDEMDAVFAGRWLWSVHRPALARFKREDYPGPPDEPLDVTIRDIVERDTGDRPLGPIRLLTHLRYFGYGFNPVSFFYCFSSEGEELEAVVAHVTSTPWGETHSYVVTPDRASLRDQEPCTSAIVNSADKALHVSPFMPMDLQHEFRFEVPSPRLRVHMTDRQAGRSIFTVDLDMQRREISTTGLARALAKYPVMTARVVVGIYYQALRLYLKRTPYHLHPARLDPQEERSTR